MCQNDEQWTWFHFIFFAFILFFSFFFIFFLDFILDLDKRCDVTVTQVTKHNGA